MPREPRPTLRLLHTADLHLGDDYGGQGLAHRALERVVDTAIARAVDIVIVAGDLFDHNRASSSDVDFVLRQLARLAMPTVLLPGNHDPLDETSIYRQADLPGRCPNVRLLSRPAGHLLRFPHLRLMVWGRPVVDHHPGFNPIADMPPRDGNHWHVAVAHGIDVPEGEASDRSSPISIGEIASSGWDYIALGHVHAFRNVSQEGKVVACYSGSPVPPSYPGEGTGCVVIVELDDELGVSLAQVPIG
ncbi:MAG: DNA repair exonuclease [Chloroflexi bacterium]|nr:DNA repair exonuclease [Chloroflexota bacterium]